MSWISAKSIVLSSLTILFFLAWSLTLREANLKMVQTPRYPTPEEAIEVVLEQRMSEIKRVCGDVCDTTMTGPFDSDKNIFVIKKKFDCRNIFETAHIHDRADSDKLLESIRVIPERYKSDFTYHGVIELLRSGAAYVWEKNNVDSAIKDVEKGEMNLGGSYSADYNVQIMVGLGKMNVTGKRVLVIGSLTPWLEVLALASGASHVVTLEYTKIICDHPKMSSYLPTDYINSYLNGSLEPFDAMLSFSSIEHSGLGRYGDGLHPWGDLVTMSRTWCVLKPGGFVLLGVPAAPKDKMVWNAHRCYGPVMTSHMFANFEYLWSPTPKMEQDSGLDCSTHKIILARKNTP